MSPAVNGLGNTQVPLANTFQPGQNNNQVKADDSSKQDNVSQAKSSGSQRAENSDKQNVSNASRSNRTEGSSEAKRGQLVDITV